MQSVTVPEWIATLRRRLAEMMPALLASVRKALDEAAPAPEPTKGHKQ